jgi:hypothetical protein
MKISKITISFLLVLSLFLTGCETVKDITDPLDDDNDESNNISSDAIEANVEEINLYFVRPADPLTIGQDVELYVDDDEIGELTYNTKIQTTVKKPGTYELATKVGWSFQCASHRIRWCLVNTKAILSLLKKTIILRLFLNQDYFVESMK